MACKITVIKQSNVAIKHEWFFIRLNEDAKQDSTGGKFIFPMLVGIFISSSWHSLSVFLRASDYLGIPQTKEDM